MNTWLPYWLAAITLACAMMGGCTICREKALVDAAKYSAQGYQTQIVAYDLTLPGRAVSAFIYDFHAQARVWQDNQWLYVGEFGGLSLEPTYTIKRIQYEWTPEAYRALLVEHGKL